MTRWTIGAVIAATALLLGGCAVAAPQTSDDGNATVPAEADPVVAAVEVLELRYEYVRDGDFASACELYSTGFLDLLAELAEADAADCVGVHEAAARNASDYLNTAREQGRAGLTPFFYVPSAIEIDEAQITSDDPTEAIIRPGAVVSLDDREFEDGAGNTPGWLSGLVYVARGADGVWRFIAPGETP